MDLRNRLCLSGHCPASWPYSVAKNFSVEHCTQTFQPDFAIHVMFIGTVDLCHLALISAIFTLPEGQNIVSLQQHLLGSFCGTILDRSG